MITQAIGQKDIIKGLSPVDFHEFLFVMESHTKVRVNNFKISKTLNPYEFIDFSNAIRTTNEHGIIKFIKLKTDNENTRLKMMINGVFYDMTPASLFIDNVVSPRNNDFWLPKYHELNNSFEILYDTTTIYSSHLNLAISNISPTTPANFTIEMLRMVKL